MRKCAGLLLFSILIPCFSFSQLQVYLLPGQGADHRLFQEINLGPDYQLIPIRYFTPDLGMDMREYAYQLSRQIDTSKPYILIGTSLGGMLATEMATFMRPKKVILLSSAKHRGELPLHYRMQKYIEINNLIPAPLAKWGAQLLQPIVEPDSKNHKELFNAMLSEKDSQFISRTIEMIISWEREEAPEWIIHIHGDEDNTLPIKNVKYDYLISGGSHMMTLTRADEINALIRKILAM